MAEVPANKAEAVDITVEVPANKAEAVDITVEVPANKAEASVVKMEGLGFQVERSSYLWMFMILLLLLSDDIIGLVIGLFVDDVWECKFHATHETPVPVNTTATSIPIDTLSIGITPQVWSMLMSALLLPYHIAYILAFIPSVKQFVDNNVTSRFLSVVKVMLFLVSLFWLIIGFRLISTISSQCNAIGKGWDISTGLALFAVFTLACFFLTFTVLSLISTFTALSLKSTSTVLSLKSTSTVLSLKSTFTALSLKSTSTVLSLTSNLCYCCKNLWFRFKSVVLHSETTPLNRNSPSYYNTIELKKVEVGEQFGDI
jgi:hypothetical protein